jgi:hypothetical protein
MAVPAIDRFHVSGQSTDLPAMERIVYADGSADGNFRASKDLELSHWVPNRTPERWAADTSTEICLRFASDPPEERYDLAINNHVDVDGMLSVFALVESPLALAHRDTVVGAAEMGDFAAGVDRRAFRLAQELTLLMVEARDAGWEPRQTYEVAFKVVSSVLAGRHAEAPSVTSGWKQIERGHERIAGGEVRVEQVEDHLVSYVLPSLEAPELERALQVPPFNALVDDSVWLWPHTRNRDHGESVQLVSIPTTHGYFHDCWLPGYIWADTPRRWRVPGLRSTGSSNVWRIDHAPLSRAVEALQRSEENVGRWILADELTPFRALLGRGFPVVTSFCDDRGRPAISALPPHAVATKLESVFVTV